MGVGYLTDLEPRPVVVLDVNNLERPTDLFLLARDEARDRLLRLGARLIHEQSNCMGSHCRT